MSNHKYTQTRIVKRRKRKLRKRVYFILIPVIIAFLTVLGYGAFLYAKADSVLSNSYEDDGREKSPLRDAEVDPSIDNVSVLIIGVDENEHRDNAGNSRSDAIMLATFNKDEKSVNLVSIPRDSYVYIPEVGYEDKITHAHAFGGPKATIETVENLLDIPVDYYVRLNFHAFVDVVDALNGITVDVPYEFKESNSMDKRDAIHLYPGEQVVDGEEALALARTRKLDNDIQRGKRQMEIVKAVTSKATSVNSILNYDDILVAVGDNMTTNMTFSEMKTFISYGTSGTNLDIQSYTLEGYDYKPAGIYYWQLDEVALTETKSMLKNHLDIPNPLVENVTSDQNITTGEDSSTSY
ncbi:LCP family protein [Oceanobacillus saliphilus]|uniref:LCP family protein n=1 Tax=Oceanobacillus saliphilus TaxID=2925834 RepID=UPI00201D6446|nr:LCP family protein [Oceanobacillus saliphilus]